MRSVENSGGPGPGRIASMDQFRGYTVAAMCLVNFLGGYAAVHPVLKHNNNYFSYADSVMPSFLFACGFSYRLSALRRLGSVGRAAAYRKFAARGLGLVLVSLMMYGFGGGFKAWAEVTPKGAWQLVAKLFKANMWEVLAIIGVAQVLVLPMIAAGVRTRALAMVALAAGHVALSYGFNFDFVYGRPNGLDDLLGIAGSSAWDGGVFGLLMWGAVMLAGSLAYDVVAGMPTVRAGTRLIGRGAAAMGVGYALSCLSMAYDGEPTTGRGHVAASPVWPPLGRLSGATAWAEPPFVKPPEGLRPNNYWMMNKKVVSLPFALFGAGFASALYGLFVLAVDRGGRGVGVFRTFGMNALAAYVIHGMVETQVHSVVPKDSPLWFCLAGLVCFSAVTYVFVRYLETQKIYIKL